MEGVNSAAKNFSGADILGVVNLTAPVQSFGQLLTLLSCNDFIEEEDNLARLLMLVIKKIKC